MARFLTYAFLVSCLVAVAAAQACTLDPTLDPTPPSFDGANSFIDKASTAGIADDVLQLSFVGTRQFSSVNFQFKRASAPAACDNLWTATTNTNANTGWTSTPDEASCAVAFQGRLPFANALRDCFVRSDADPTYTVFTAYIAATTTQVRLPINGIDQTRTVSTALQLQIRLPRFVTVSSNASVDYLPDYLNTTIFQHALQSQLFNIDDYSTDIVLFTSIYYPFELITAGSTVNALPAGYSLSSPTADATNVACPADRDTFCPQRWDLKLTPPADACNIQATISVTLKVDCRPEYPADCSAVGFPKDGATMTYTLSANNFCPEIIDSGELNPTLTTYDSQDYNSVSSNFVYNQLVFVGLNIEVVKGIGLAQTTITRVIIRSYNHNQILDGTQYALDPWTPYQIYFSFLLTEDIVSSESLSSAQGVTIEVQFEVEYVALNGEAPVKEARSAFLSVGSGFHMQGKTDTLTSTTSIVVAAQESTSQPATSSSGAALSLTSIIAIVVGVVAAIIALVSFVALRIMKQQVSKTSVQLETITNPPAAKEPIA